MQDTRIHTGIPNESTSTVHISRVQRIVALLQRALHVQTAGERHLKRVETLTLGSRKSVHLIECDGQRFLIADGLSAPVPTSDAGSEVGR